MSFCLKVHSHPRSKDFTALWINYNMTPKDVIEILRVQSNMMKNCTYGLMISLPRNKCKWLNEDEVFGKIIIDEDDLVFIQPFYKLIIIELPDKTCTQRKVNIRSPTENVVKELCFQFKIYPYEIWGAYIDARGENILLIPNQSISEQAPDIQKIYLKQYLFPESLKPDVLSPHNLYIMQYRSMIINSQFGNEPDDLYYLKGKNWYLTKDILDGLPHSETSQRKELTNIFSLKSFGSVYFVVRFHETVGLENSHSFEKIKKLTIAKKALYLADIDCKNSQKTVVPFSSIKYVGIRDEFLKITFGFKEWHFISHRSSEIDVIICQLMKNYNFTIPLADLNSDIFLPRTYYSYESQIYFLPDKVYSTEELIHDNMKILASKYSKLVDLYNNDDFNEDYSLAQISINTSLDELSNIFKNRHLDIPKNIDQINLSIQRVKSIDSGLFENQLDYLYELKCSLLRLNEVLHKETENLEYRRIKKRIKRAIDPYDDDINDDDENTPLSSLNNIVEYNLSKQRNLQELTHDQNENQSLKKEEEESSSYSDIFEKSQIETKSIKSCQNEQLDEENKVFNLAQTHNEKDIKDIDNKEINIVQTVKLNQEEENNFQTKALDDSEAKASQNCNPLKSSQNQYKSNIEIQPISGSNSFSNSEDVEIEEEEEDHLDMAETPSYNYISTNSPTIIISNADNEHQQSDISSQYDSDYESSTLFNENDKENQCILMFPTQDKKSSLNKDESDEVHSKSSLKIDRLFEKVETSCPENIQIENQEKNAQTKVSDATVQITSNDQSETYESTETTDNSIIKDLTFHNDETGKNSTNENDDSSIKIIDNLNATDTSCKEDIISKDVQTENDDSSLKIIDNLNATDTSCKEDIISKDVQTENDDTSLKIIDNLNAIDIVCDDDKINKDMQTEDDDTSLKNVYNLNSTDTGCKEDKISQDFQTENVKQSHITIDNLNAIDIICDEDKINTNVQTENDDTPLNSVNNLNSTDISCEEDKIGQDFQTESTKQSCITIDNLNSIDIVCDEDKNNKDMQTENNDSSIETIDNSSQNDSICDQKEIKKDELSEISESIETNDDTEINDICCIQNEIDEDKSNENHQSLEAIDSSNIKNSNCVQNFITKDEQIESNEQLEINDSTITNDVNSIQSEINNEEREIIKNTDEDQISKSQDEFDNSNIEEINPKQNEITKNEQTETIKSQDEVDNLNIKLLICDQIENKTDDQTETKELLEVINNSSINEITKNEQNDNIKSLEPSNNSNIEELNCKQNEICKNDQTENDELSKSINNSSINENYSKQNEIAKNNQIENVKSQEHVDNLNIKDLNYNQNEIKNYDQTETKELLEVINNSNIKEINSKQKEITKNEQNDNIKSLEPSNNSNIEELNCKQNEISKNDQTENDELLKSINNSSINEIYSKQNEIAKNNQIENVKSQEHADKLNIKDLNYNQNEIKNYDQTETKELLEVINNSNIKEINPKQNEITKNEQTETIKSQISVDNSIMKNLNEISKEKQNQNDESLEEINNIKTMSILNDKPINVIENNDNVSNSNSKFIIVENDSFSSDNDESSDNIICSPLIKNSQKSKRQSQSPQNIVFSPTKRKHETSSKLSFVVEDDDDDCNDFQVYNRATRTSKSPSHRRNESLVSFQGSSGDKIGDFPVDLYGKTGSKQSMSMSRSHFMKMNNRSDLDDTSDIESSQKENEQMKSSVYTELNDMKWNSKAVTNNYNIKMNCMNQLSPTNQDKLQQMQQSQMTSNSPLSQSMQPQMFNMNFNTMNQVYNSPSQQPQSPSQSLQPQQFQMQLRAMQSQPQFEMQQVQINQSCLSPSRSLQPDQFQMQLQMQQNQIYMKSPSQSMQYQAIQAAGSPIPVPCFGQISSQFTPFSQQIVPGFQLSPGFYSPSPAASPSTHIEASPKITVKVGGSGGKRRKSKKNKKAHKKWENESTESSSYDEESSSEDLSLSSESDDGCETTDEIIEQIEKSSQKVAELVNLKKDPNRELRTLGQLFSHLGRKFDEDIKGDEANRLAKKIKQILKHKSDKKSCLRLVDDITKTINNYFAEFKKVFKDPIIRQTNDIIKITNNTNDQDLNDLALSLAELKKKSS